jgi:hypothetical protein
MAGLAAVLAAAGPAASTGPEWSPSEALAQRCGSEPLSARGEPARFEWLARTAARGNWRARVRVTPGLGPAFTNWGAARDTEERCISGDGRIVCIFTGVPCRS